MVGLFDVAGLESRHRVIIKCLQTSELSSYPVSWEAADGEGCARSPGGLRWQIIREMRWNNTWLHNSVPVQPGSFCISGFTQQQTRCQWPGIQPGVLRTGSLRGGR